MYVVLILIFGIDYLLITIEYLNVARRFKELFPGARTLEDTIRLGLSLKEGHLVVAIVLLRLWIIVSIVMIISIIVFFLVVVRMVSFLAVVKRGLLSGVLLHLVLDISQELFVCR